ncbi:amidase [Saccharopolyspora phatthalungensis]|uniref:Aspartyl-tRNA(Asn)/glutamyl-tRNA(Gln) amidotransferase subunit A n=1 Tax=Saccharopolyspora phatthalungensis TaxID=664693 RepID=A0A840QHH4_9PSEU|nr:amidase [Saccharopolyspora phatthalungensis]MBB5158099.1 aspartyl-tRNA(Asn)/glutamyl-tRNA(Gln) amidotransferase subunit A [Saccharopolyspora phatthalungensis]
MTELADLSAVDLVAAYRAGETSPVEVIDAVLARVDSCEPKVCALYALDPAAARAAARSSERRWLAGAPAGPVDGVPVTVKENIATRGTPVPQGTAATELVPVRQDAPAPARLRESGAVIFAKTTMPDYGMLSSGVSSFHHLARNPWDLTRTPGGSSAGAGAAAAAGYGPLHVGTDIGGSVRLPAGWCGVVGLKPSFGRIPVAPPYTGRVIGPLTRTVADTALLTSVLSAPDERDHTSLPPVDHDWMRLDGEVRGLRIALLLDHRVGLPVEPVTIAAVTAAAQLLESAGAVVEPIDPFLSREMLDGMDRFWRFRSWTDISALPAERRAKVLPGIAQWATNAKDISAAEVFHGFSQMDAISVAANRVARDFDYVLSPVAPIPAFPAEQAYPTNDPMRPMEHIAFTLPYNMSGQPAVSVNCGWTPEGLPIGLQIAGKRFDDLGVLRLARAYEQLRPPQRPWPTL